MLLRQGPLRQLCTEAAVVEDSLSQYDKKWGKIFNEFLGLPKGLFDGKYHDSPCCGTAKAFKGFIDLDFPVLVCEGCGGADGGGGGLRPFQFIGMVLKCSIDDARSRVNKYLGATEVMAQPSHTLLEQLQELPDSWGLVAVDGNKRPYQNAWQNNPLSKAQVADEITAGRAKAVGVIAGAPSNGLLFVDHDGISATEVLEKLGIPLRDLPRSVAVTSGRDGRFQIIYQVPAFYWSDLVGRRVFKSGKTDTEGKAEQLEVRWANCQSVVIGSHPLTSGYRWLKGRSPSDLEIATAPTALIELLLDQPEPEPTPLLSYNPPTGATVPFLNFITRDSKDLIDSGGAPGQWNDDQLRLALDLKGTEEWIIQQGARPDISASDAFALHIAAARSKARDFDEKKAWHRFNGADKQHPTPGTPHDKLLSRLSYHTRTTREILPRQKEAEPAAATAVEETSSIAPAIAKPQKLEAAELLYMLRSQAKGGKIRWNIFTQQIEVDGKAFDGTERFYLTLAEQGFKVSKELSLDCLIQVAKEHNYDPVRLYLEHVADTIEPAYIDALATAYLRPQDASAGAVTLYDHMLRCTLIGAVRRAFEPGCKHDTACVLMGDQGARKSSFWEALAGGFFSDALGDIASKDDLMVLHRSWIMEWAELDHIVGRKHAGHVKAFLSQATDLFRVPYGKAAEPFPRRGIIVGSTNRSTGFLVDETGNRRFWVIPTTCTASEPIDTANLLAERDAIWSAAVHAYRNGDRNYLPAHLDEEVTERNQDYQVDNPWKAPIEAWLQAPQNRLKDITGELILCEAIQKPIERQSRSDQMQIGMIMRDLGYEKRRQMVHGIQRWVYGQPVANP